eukprot:3554346-Prymnesium_polylepis.2
MEAVTGAVREAVLEMEAVLAVVASVETAEAAIMLVSVAAGEWWISEGGGLSCWQRTAMTVGRQELVGRAEPPLCPQPTRGRWSDR